MSKLCGCYHCLAAFYHISIKTYTPDGFAVCPKCGIDSVVRLNGATDDKLIRLHRQWYTPKDDNPLIVTYCLD